MEYMEETSREEKQIARDSTIDITSIVVTWLELTPDVIPDIIYAAIDTKMSA